MLPAHNSRKFIRLLRCYVNAELYGCKRRSLSSEAEVSKTPNYPPIMDLSDAAIKKRDKLRIHEKYRKLNTVEEKLFALNMPRYWGWKAILLKEGELPYNVLPFVKYITRTQFNETVNIPFNNYNLDIQPEDLINVIKSQIQEAILFEKFGRRYV